MKRNHEHAESCEYIHVHEEIVEKVNAQMPEEEDLDLKCLGIPPESRCCMC